MKYYVTGHRFLEHEASVQAEINALITYLKSSDSQVSFSCNLSCGADILFVQAAQGQQCDVEIELPFQTKFYELDFDKASINQFNAIISKTHFSIFNQIETPDEASKKLAYEQAGNKLIKAADGIIAIWDGKQGQGQGGTKDQIDYALKLNKPIHWIKANRKDTPTTPLAPEIQTLQDQFTSADSKAIQAKNKYLQFWTSGLVLGILAVACFAINFCFLPEHLSLLKSILSITEILFIVSSFYILGNRANHYKKQFLTHRKTAEFKRAEIWQQELNAISLQSTEQIAEKDREGIITNQIKSILWTHTTSQIQYQTKRRINRFKNAIHSVHTHLKRLKYTFIVVISIIALLEINHAGHIFHFEYAETSLNLLSFLWLMIPPIYATLEGIIYYNDWSKSIKYANELISAYQSIITQIDQIKTKEDLDSIIKQMHDYFTFEINTWIKEEDNKQLESKI